VNNYSLVICYFINIFFIYKLINYCNAILHCYAATYYAAISLITLYYNNYVSYFVVKCDLAYSHFFSYDKVCATSFKVTSYVSPFFFLRSLWIFSISALNSLHFSFLLANKRSGMSGGNGGYQFQKLKVFLIIIIKLSWKINL